MSGSTQNGPRHPGFVPAPLVGFPARYSTTTRTEETRFYNAAQPIYPRSTSAMNLDSNSQSDWKTVSPREKRVVLRPQSWHNKTGEIIRQIEEGVWVIERGYIFLNTIDVGGRTTLIRLPDGGLFVHAPLALTKVLKECIDEIGKVQVVVAPNTEHVDFIAQWKTFYPEACYLGPPGSLQKLPQVPFTRELSQDGTPDSTISDLSMSQFFIASAPFFNETVFVHHPSKSLLCTDFFWAYPSRGEVPMPTLAWGWAMNRIYKPVYDWVLIKDQQQFLRCLNSIIDTGFERIIPCHGDVIDTDGVRILTEFFAQKLKAI